MVAWVSRFHAWIRLEPWRVSISVVAQYHALTTHAVPVCFSMLVLIGSIYSRRAVAPLPRVLAIGGFMGMMMMLDRPISVLSHQDEVILLMAALLLGELWANLELAPL